ncbi:MAG: hypothetical protein RR978_00240 [Oscillospiraceae bacterium]
MQDNNSRGELDELLQDILQGKAHTDFGEENDIDNILADLGLESRLECNDKKTPPEPPAPPVSKINSFEYNPDPKSKKSFLADESFAETFAPKNDSSIKNVDLSTLQDDEFSEDNDVKQAPVAPVREHKSFKERLLKTKPSSTWDSDEEDDEYQDAFASVLSHNEQSPLSDTFAPMANSEAIQPVQSGKPQVAPSKSVAEPLHGAQAMQRQNEPSHNVATSSSISPKAPQIAPNASQIAPKTPPIAPNASQNDLPEGGTEHIDAFAEKPSDKLIKDDEEPTLEFLAATEAVAHAHKAKAATFVIKPNYEEEAANAAVRTGTMKLSEVDETFREFFGETVAIDRDELEKGLHGNKAGKLLRSFFGARRAETGELTGDIDIPLPTDADESANDKDDDYNTPSDAPAVESTLKSMRTNCTLRIVACGLTTLLLLYLGLSSRTGLLPSIPVLNPANEPFLFLIVNLILLIVTGLVSFPTITSGISALFKDASADILPSIALLGAIIQNLAFVIKPEQFSPEKVTLFAPIAALLMLTNAIGKHMHCNIVCRNFSTVSVGHEHAAAYVIKDKELSSRVCEGLAEPEPALLVSRPTALVRGFLRQSFSVRQSDYTARIMGYIALFCAFVCGIITYISTKNIFTAISAFAALLCFASPLASTLLSAVPSLLMQRSATRVGAVVPGWSAIAALGEANVALVNARDLFPPSTVRLHGIKTFEKERIDLAILYAASIFIESCDTLRDIFLGVIENKTDMLYKTESVGIEPGYGFTAWIEHSRVVLGNRAMMQKHDIDIPSLDYEMKYTKGERCPIYLAVSGKLFGMFVVSYSPDEDAMEVVQGLRKSGISLLVKSDDFNINSELITDVYDLPKNSVKVLTGIERDALAAKTSYMPESEGVLTHMGTFSSFIGGLRAAAGTASGERMASFVQCAAIILGVALGVLLSVTNGLTGISLAAVILFQCAWAALTLLVPLAKRY